MIQHFIEIKKRLLFCVITFITIFTIFYIYSDYLYLLISTPLLKYLPQGSNVIATQVVAPFLVPVKLCLFLTLLTCFPIFIYNIWAFILPGLYKEEKNVITPVLFYSIILFYSGILFSFSVLVPLGINFFSSCAPQGISVMTDIGNYLDFVTTITLFSGIIFQVPVITKMLIKLNVISKKQFKQKRRYVIIFAFVLGMLLTPPDVLSQIVLAIPLWFLFELGLFFS